MQSQTANQLPEATQWGTLQAVTPAAQNIQEAIWQRKFPREEYINRLCNTKWASVTCHTWGKIISMSRLYLGIYSHTSTCTQQQLMEKRGHGSEREKDQVYGRTWRNKTEDKMMQL